MDTSRRAGLLALFVAVGVMAAPVRATPVFAARPATFANCAGMHVYYPHGIGRRGAHDRVGGHTRPVTNFYVSTRLYNLNHRLDADRDGVACEKR